MKLGDVMSVLINKKRCDNADACSCISECPTKAFYWDTENQTVAVDNNLCINCRNCMISCEAGAVKVARNQEEYEKIKTEYDEDIMTIEKLFQDRYGASLVEEKYTLDISELEKIIVDSNKPLLLEFYNEEEARCLINSIPIEEIMKEIPFSVSYRKVNISEIDSLINYHINNVPSLIVVKEGEVIYGWNGFVHVNEKEKLLEDLKEKLH